jgi:predicted  nucleic acid-binding Zn-ribbon protein
LHSGVCNEYLYLNLYAKRSKLLETRRSAYSKEKVKKGEVIMDERKRTIREYEYKRRETLNSIEGMLENLGASLLPHAEQDDGSDYRRLTRDIGDSGAYITAIEGDIARLKIVEEDIQRKDQENAARIKDLANLFTRLGESVLETDCIDAVKPYQSQAETLYSKIKSLEERLEQLEDRGGGNVFTWIGKNTQGMVLRSFLGKSRNSLQKIFTAAGEKYSQSVSSVAAGGNDARPFLEEIDVLKQESAVLVTDITRLKEERRRINDVFSPDGGPARKIQSLERHIALAREELRGVFLRYGREIEAAGDGGAEAAVPPMSGADIQLLEDIRRGRESIREYDREIEKLKTSLAIDEEKEAVVKMEKAVRDHEGRIRVSEEAIADLSARIKEANARIENLTGLL